MNNPESQLPEPGAPVYSRDRVGYVGAVQAAGGGLFAIGAGGLTAIAHDVEVIFDSHVAVLALNIVQPWLDRAAQMQLAPISAEELAAKRAAAEGAHDQARAEAMAKREAEKARRAAFRIEAAARLPAGAKAVIIGEYQQDKLDSMSDYWGSKTVRRVILAFSPHVRDLFPELRKAALNCPETAFLAEEPEAAEHREKYSMGGGYYLKSGHRHATGWRIKKCRFYDNDPLSCIDPGDWFLPVAEAAPISAPTLAGGGAFAITEHTHTRKGFQMWIVSLAGRVERAEFDRLSGAARALGGWYSRAWEGSPAGFAFKREAAARTFAEGLGGGGDGPDGGERAPAAVRAPSPAIGDKLRALADGLQGDIEHKRGERRTNTPKQQREAQSARLDAARLERTQQGLRALADHHDAGTVPDALRGVTTKAAVFDLARGEIITSGRYYDAGHESGQPAKDTPASRALWAMIGGPSAADRAAADLRDKVESLKFANIPGFFATPPAVVAQMIEAARLPETGRVLEPSAGSGAILDAVREAAPGCELFAFERHNTLAEILRAKGYCVNGDFTESAPFTVDRVLMNPPFENGQDMQHVQRAFAHLGVGGRLVAIMSPGPFFRSDARATLFREWFDELGGERTDLPPGSFKASGTGVGAVLVVLDK